MAVAILVVDDDPTFRELVRPMLAARGLVVVCEAASFAEAVSRAEALKPSAALVDLQLPDGDGFDLARRLTALPWRPRVVLTSVMVDVGAGEWVKRSGAEAFVPKIGLEDAPLARLLGGD